MSTDVFLVDGFGLIFRSYFAHIRNPLRNSKGQNTSAIYGFLQYIKKIYNDYTPQNIVIALDSSEKILKRKKLYPNYKANRQKTPEDLIFQIGVIIDIIKAMEIPHLSVAGYEADDIIATIATSKSKEKITSNIVSSDKDLFQLLNSRISILRPSAKSSDWEKVTPDWVKEQYGIEASQMHDYLSIVGDSSDNIPGIPGIGPKTATRLLQDHKTLQGIFENIDTIKENWRKKLIDTKDIAELSYTLVALYYSVPIPNNFNTEYTIPLWHKANALFEQYDIRSFQTKSHTKLSSTRNVQNNKKTLTTDTDTDIVQNTASGSSSTTLLSTISPKEAPFLITVIHKVAQLQEVVDIALKQNYISLYPVYEGRALHASLTGLALSCDEKKAYYLAFKESNNQAHAQEKQKKESMGTEQLMTDNDTRDVCMNILRSLFKSKNCVLIFHDAKQALSVLHNEGLLKQHNCFHPKKQSIAIIDCVIAAWLLRPEIRHYDMASLCNRYLGDQALSTWLENIHAQAKTETFVSSDFQTLVSASTSYSVALLAIWNTLKEKLKETAMYEEYISTEIYFCSILSNIERLGIAINVPYLKTLSSQFAHMLERIEAEIYQHSGEKFNINSPKQLQEILFEKLKLPVIKKTKTGYSTDVHVLAFLSEQHPLPKKILEFRHISKLKNTYSDTLPEQIDVHTKKIHTSLNQNGSETGRLSSTNPNLQNIPIKDSIGQQLRHAFVAQKGHKLISADYSQIELVVLAHFSKDATLTNAFEKKIDIHTRTASILFQTDETQIDDTKRRIAKSINFGVIYGMSAFRLSNELKISQNIAKEFIDAYFNEFSSIREYIHNTITIAEQQNYTTTLLGRRRYHENINSKNKNLKNAAERMVVNSTIQGSAADIMKLAMIKVYDVLQKRSLTSRIILQIHDELLLDCPEEEVSIVLDLLYEIMPQAYSLSVPLSISAKAGNNWGEIK